MKEDEPDCEVIQAAYKALEVAHRINLEKYQRDDLGKYRQDAEGMVHLGIRRWMR